MFALIVHHKCDVRGAPHASSASVWFMQRSAKSRGAFTTEAPEIIIRVLEACTKTTGEDKFRNIAPFRSLSTLKHHRANGSSYISEIIMYANKPRVGKNIGNKLNTNI